MSKYLHLFDNHYSFETNRPNIIPNVSVCKNHIYPPHYSEPIYLGTSLATGYGFTSRAIANNTIDFTYCKKIRGQIKRILGNAIVWNQMSRPAASTIYSCTSYNKATDYIENRDGGTIPINHKIFLSYDYRLSTNFAVPSNGVQPNILLSQNNDNLYGGQLFATIIKDYEWHQQTGVITNLNSTNNHITINAGQPASSGTPNITGTFEVKSINAIDLTLMFGFNNELTAENFQQLFPLNYYNLNSGSFLTLKNTTLYSKDSNGNIIDGLELNIQNITGKRDGSDTSEVIFPDGMLSTLGGATGYDEIVKENGLWVAYRRICYDKVISNNAIQYNSDRNYFGLQAPNRSNQASNGSASARCNKYAIWFAGVGQGYPQDGPDRTMNPIYHAWASYINFRDLRYNTSTIQSALISAGTEIMYRYLNSYCYRYVLDDEWQQILNQPIEYVPNGIEELSSIDESSPTTAPIRLDMDYYWVG